MHNKKMIISIIIAVIVLVAIVLIIVLKPKSGDNLDSLANQDTDGLGATLYQNPLDSGIPQVNPFEVETNPFKNAYQNPFAK
jgi:hypothetical protein